jgi:hypothetical protein
VDYQIESAHTGKIVLRSSRQVEKAYVSINDHLIVNKKKIKSVTIKNVPIGNYNIHYTSGNWWYKERLDMQLPVKMESGKEVMCLVKVPPYRTGYWFYIAGQAVLSAAVGWVLK